MAALLACALALGTAHAHARTLAEIQARGVVSQCANPDALPHSSNKADPPGYQIEIGRALAQALHVKHEVSWIIPRTRAGLVDCDLLLDTIVAAGTDPGPLKVSHPYQRSGVGLALRPGPQPVRGFADIAPGQRIGVMIESLASKILGQRGVRTVPYTFERDMVDDVGKGEIDGCAATPATIQYYMHEHPDAGLRYAAAYESEPELQWALAVGMRRSDEALVSAVNAALDELGASGALARIYARYGVEYRKP
jgi:ABC-type amino acid transport substrate-binding protein